MDLIGCKGDCRNTPFPEDICLDTPGCAVNSYDSRNRCCRFAIGITDCRGHGNTIASDRNFNCNGSTGEAGFELVGFTGFFTGLIFFYHLFDLCPAAAPLTETRDSRFTINHQEWIG
jgi:hypothetical protein